MNLKQSIQDFRETHRNSFNLVTHILSGFLYMTLFLLMFGKYAYVAYTGIVFLLLPKYTLAILLMFVGLFFFTNIIQQTLRLTTTTSILVILVFYFGLDLSHWLTNEPTALTIQNITIPAVLENFFLLLPYSIITSLT